LLVMGLGSNSQTYNKYIPVIASYHSILWSPFTRISRFQYYHDYL